MVTIDTVLNLAVLPLLAGVETSQERNGVDFVLGGFILVLEAARISLGTGTSQIVVIAKLVAIFSLLNAVQCRLRHLKGRIQSAATRVPRGWLRRRWSSRCRCRTWL